MNGAERGRKVNILERIKNRINERLRFYYYF
jgi:hypothetical protein